MDENGMSEQLQSARERLFRLPKKERTPEEIIAARAFGEYGPSASRIPHEILVTKGNLNNLPCEEYIFADACKIPRDKIVLFLHGGGFASGSIASRRYLVTTALKYAELNGISITYTQYPEGQHPQGLLDCVSAYTQLLKRGFDANNIYLLGESAGAAMCLSMTLYLKDHAIDLPGRICLFSPPTNLAEEYLSRRSRAQTDPIVPANFNSSIRYFETSDKRSPYVSPIYGDFVGFPPLYINVGTDEVLFDDSVSLYKKCLQAGTDVHLKIWEGLFHVFPLVPSPESEEALKLAGRFLSGSYKSYQNNREEPKSR